MLRLTERLMERLWELSLFICSYLDISRLPSSIGDACIVVGSLLLIYGSVRKS